MTMSSQLLPTTTLTGSSLDSGMGADLRKGEMVPLWMLSQKFLMDQTETSSESNLYLDPLLLMKRILGVEDTSTPRYSASLSQSPCPSFLEETERIMPGFVASQSLKAWRAPAYASSSPKKRKRASLLSLNTFSMASLLKGITSDRAEARRRVKMTVNFMDILKL